MTPGKVFRLSLQFLPAFIIPPMLLTHLLSRNVKIGCSSKAVQSHHTVTAGAMLQYHGLCLTFAITAATVGCSAKGLTVTPLLWLLQCALVPRDSSPTALF